ncbi:lasso peptide biosynthesis B2 protein [Nonomuraea sp. CA-143628]|uniref:lasso peptide biosynthesis B2 protein n=1 Tax=Nonomuraea sp. CA-143628 TaxID=3239997 RepID=UPI003D948DB5
MSHPMTSESRARTSLARTSAALLAVAAARPLAGLRPYRIRRVLGVIRRGAVAATAAQALAARDDVVAVSRRCAGPACLQRSLATAILCRLRGTWPTWCAGVRVEPFRAHAWVQVNGQPVGESYPAGYYRPIMTVAAPQTAP